MMTSKILSVRPTRRFINVAFLVMPGAALVFDMPETLFGPNDVSRGLFTYQTFSMVIIVSRGGELRVNTACKKGNGYFSCVW